MVGYLQNQAWNMMAQHQTFSKVAEKLKDLPVNAVAADVVDSVAQGKVGILTAETGSGKTLLANAMLADASDDPVLVLVPRRFLAINAAESIAELAEVNLGEEVGFAVGQQSGDRSQFGPQTKLLFATYGYALASGMLETAKTVVCDEVHEAGVDTSLARALLHERMERDPGLRVVEMSATLNAQKQAEYWSDVKEVDTHHADGRAFPCETRHVPSHQAKVEQVAIDLIENEGRKGIAVFRPGVGEVEQTVADIRELALQHGLTNVEVEAIYGDMDMEERQRATRPPAEGNVKVLVGTNVIESGVNIKWLDTGISDGKGKVPYYRDTGAQALVLEDLPQWRIVQQEGRVKRFTEGLFVLASDTPLEDRAQQQTPEIERMALTRLVMHAAGFGINPSELKYDGKVDRHRLNDAKQQLMNLQLLTEDWKLTDKGQFVMTLPVGPEAGALLESARPEHIDAAIELAAVVEVGGLRADYKRGHGMDNGSDIFDGLKAYRQLAAAEVADEEELQERCADANVSWKRFCEVRDMAKDMHRRLDGKKEGVEQQPASRRDMQMMLLNGSVNHLFETRVEAAPPPRGKKGRRSPQQQQPKAKVFHRNLFDEYTDYPQANASVVGGDENRFAVGSLREIPGAQEDDITIVQNVTKIPKEVFTEFAASRDDVLSDISIEVNHRGRMMVEGKYFGQTPLSLNLTNAPDHVKQAFEEREAREAAAKRQPQEKPQGVANSNVQEVQREQRRARG